MGLDIRGMAPLLQVFDMPTSIAFYCGMLGFEVATTSEPGPKFDWALLRLNGVELMLNTAYERDKRPPAPVRARIAAHDDTCLYFGAPDVDAVHKDLLAKGLNGEAPKGGAVRHEAVVPARSRRLQPVFSVGGVPAGGRPLKAAC